jgi:hypothetical protein
MAPATLLVCASTQQIVVAERANLRSFCSRRWRNGPLWHAGALLLLESTSSWQRRRRCGQELLSAVLMALLTWACLEVLSTVALLLAVVTVLLLPTIALLFVRLSIALALLLAVVLLVWRLLMMMAVAWVEITAATATMTTRIEISIAVVRHCDCFFGCLSWCPMMLESEVKVYIKCRGCVKLGLLAQDAKSM